MYENGSAFMVKCGDGTISIVEEKIAAKEYLKCLESNPYFFVDLTRGGLVKDKTYKPVGEVVAM